MIAEGDPLPVLPNAEPGKPSKRAAIATEPNAAAPVAAAADAGEEEPGGDGGAGATSASRTATDMKATRLWKARPLLERLQTVTPPQFEVCDCLLPVQCVGST